MPADIIVGEGALVCPLLAFIGVVGSCPYQAVIVPLFEVAFVAVKVKLVAATSLATAIFQNNADAKYGAPVPPTCLVSCLILVQPTGAVKAPRLPPEVGSVPTTWAIIKSPTVNPVGLVITQLVEFAPGLEP